MIMPNRLSLKVAGVALAVVAIVVMTGSRWPETVGENDPQQSPAGRAVPPADERQDDVGAVSKGARGANEPEGGAVKMTAALVKALPSPLTVLEKDPEAAVVVEAQLARVDQALKERRKESIHGQQIAVGKTLRFPAQTGRELARLVSGMRLPASISGDQAEVIRTMAMAQFSKEYGVTRTVTPMLRMDFSIRGIVRLSFVNFDETGDGSEPVTVWANRCDPAISKAEWKFDFIVSPELVALEAEASELFRQKVSTGGDGTAAGETVCRELTEREARR